MSIRGEKISIIIATFSRPELLHNLLTAMMMQNAEQKFEIVIAIDGGEGNEKDDGYEDVIKAFAGCSKFNLKVLRLPASGPAYCRNRAIEASSGTHLLFTDDDIVPPPNWISELLFNLNEYPESAVMGPVRWHWEVFQDTLTKWLDDTETQFIPEIKLKSMGEWSSILYTCNAGIRRKLLGNIRFNEEFRSAAWEDVEFSSQLKENDISIRIVPEAAVYHRFQPSLKKLEAKMRNSGREYRHFLLKNAKVHPEDNMAKIKVLKILNRYFPQVFRSMVKLTVSASDISHIFYPVARRLLSAWLYGIHFSHTP